MSNNNNRLGKGLDSLIPEQIDSLDEFAGESLPQEVIASDKSAGEIPIDNISVNPYQPRTDFEAVELQQLADSIKIGRAHV